MDAPLARPPVGAGKITRRGIDSGCAADTDELTDLTNMAVWANGSWSIGRRESFYSRWHISSKLDASSHIAVFGGLTLRLTGSRIYRRSGGAVC